MKYLPFWAIGLLMTSLAGSAYSQSPALDALTRDSLTAALADKEHLNFVPPEDYQLASRQSDGRAAEISLYVPSSETADTWNSSVRVVTFSRPMSLTALEVNTGTAKNMEQFCAAPEARSMFDGTENDYDVSQWYVGCNLNQRTNKPEYMINKIIKGQYSTQSIAFTFESVPTSEQMKFATEYMRHITLCNIDGSNHPCPTQ